MPRRSRSLSSMLAGTSTPTVFTDGLPLPKLIVFDLDFSLWGFWVDTHVTPPLKPVNGGAKVQDRYRESLAFYDDVPDVLATIKHHGIQIGAASRTGTPALAREMLSLLRIPVTPSSASSSTTVSTPSSSSSISPVPKLQDSKTRKAIEFFDHLQIFPGSKTAHFTQIKRDSGIAYEEMLFFDDESRNRNVESLGVVMWLVRDGVTWAEVESGVQSWRKRSGNAKPSGGVDKGEL